MQEHSMILFKANDLEMTFDLEVTLTPNVKVILFKCYEKHHNLGSAFF